MRTERLDRLFSAQTANATPQQRFAITRWQGKDRFYEKVQEALGGAGDPEAMVVAGEIQKLAQPLPEDTELWRGIRSIRNTFRVNRAAVESLAGLEWVADRFTSATISRKRATPEFTEPGSTPALLQIAARVGARAVWVPPLGDPNLARQSELLFVRGIKVRILDVDSASDIPLIRVEVT